MRFETQTYTTINTDFTYHQTCALIEPKRQAQSVSSGLLAYLALMRLWMSSFVELCRAPAYRSSKRFRSFALIPDAMCAAKAPRILANRQSKRIMRRGLPAARLYVGLRHLNARQLTGNQFLERACRLSANGRACIYRLEYKTRLCQRRQVNHILSALAQLCPAATVQGCLINAGLSAAHVWPS